METTLARFPACRVSVDEDLLLLEEEQDPKWTPAEKAFQLARKKREKERVNERLKFTHRQRMEKLNAHLASLSERKAWHGYGVYLSSDLLMHRMSRKKVERVVRRSLANRTDRMLHSSLATCRLFEAVSEQVSLGVRTARTGVQGLFGCIPSVPQLSTGVPSSQIEVND